MSMQTRVNIYRDGQVLVGQCTVAEFQRGGRVQCMMFVGHCYIWCLN